MFWPTQWATTETQLHLHNTESTLTPPAGKDSCFMSCYKTCQKPTRVASEEKFGDLQDKESKITQL